MNKLIMIIKKIKIILSVWYQLPIDKPACNLNLLGRSHITAWTNQYTAGAINQV